MRVLQSAAIVLTLSGLAAAQTNQANQPSWWNKYQQLSANGASGNPAGNKSNSSASNVDVSNECGPQSETYITLNTQASKQLAAGSNEIFRLPMRGYASADGGSSWTGVDLPLPPPLNGTNDTRFGSDPSLVFDTKGNLFYSYIVVFFGGGNGVDGSEMAVARSSDGGKSYPFANFFSFSSGSNHFNDKPMITADRNSASPYRDSVYVAWDAASGGSTGGGVRFARSTDSGQTFIASRIDNPSGPGRAIGAVPFTGPNGEVYVAWNDYSANNISFVRSLDGGGTFSAQTVVANKSLAFDIAIPAEFSRAALVYPACDADRSNSTHRGRLYCSWMDLTTAGTTNILLSYSDDQGASWSKPASVTDHLPFAVDRFNQWLSVDPVTGVVDVSFYDTRNDTTGSRYQTDTYLAESKDGGVSWSPNVRVSTASSNEHDCGGVYPCSAIDYGNQQGDYEGLVSFNGSAHPVWTDSRNQLQPASGCRTGLAMEEVFTATVPE